MKRVPLALLLFAVLMVMRSTAAAQACGDQRCDPEFMAECRAGGGIVVNPEDPGCYCDYATPIIVDTGDGIALTSPTGGVMFDLRATGTPQRVSWTQPGSHGGFLILDRNGNGIIDDGREMFGDVTVQPSSPEPNGFLALAEFDKTENGGNGDGVIDEHDSVFAKLRLWIDVNHNGYSEPNELFALPALGVNCISLDYREARKRDHYGNIFRYRAKASVETTDQSGPWAYDVFFRMQPSPLLGKSTSDTPMQPTPGTIDGAKNPELIPTEVAFNIFLRVASCPSNATPLQLKKCGLARRAVGLGAEDDNLLGAELASFAVAVQPLDQQIAALHGAHDDPSQDFRKTLTAQRRDLLHARAWMIRHKISDAGRQKLDMYVEGMKAKIKTIPASAGH